MAGIVVGFDGSKNAEAALSWAMRRAVNEHLGLTVLTINELAVSPWTGSPSVVNEDEVMLKKARQAADDAVARCSRDVTGPLSVTVTAINGIVGDELISASRTAEMLVIGSRGELDFPALRVSEIAAKVAHYASCPVVIVPPAA